jgi:hypothetical protein
LSPGWFAKAETSLARAKKALSKGDEISEIMENVIKGRAQLKTAEEMAQVARTTLPEIHKPPASITLAPIKHALAVTLEPFKFSPAEPVAYELSD